MLDLKAFVKILIFCEGLLPFVFFPFDSSPKNFNFTYLPVKIKVHQQALWWRFFILSRWGLQKSTDWKDFIAVGASSSQRFKNDDMFPCYCDIILVSQRRSHPEWLETSTLTTCYSRRSDSAWTNEAYYLKCTLILFVYAMWWWK